MSNKGLGKGLSALLGVEASDNNRIAEININQIIANSMQPRKSFNEAGIDELAESIKLHGIIQPILVQKHEDGLYQIIAGERRYRAAKQANLSTMPCIVKNTNPKNGLEIALIENIQRQDLDPVEEAEAYQHLISEYNYTQEEVAKIIGKSRSHIANLLRISHLPEDIKLKLKDGSLTIGHAKILVGHPDIRAIVENIITNSLNVRQTEALVKKWGKTNIKSSHSNILSTEYQDDLTNLVNMLSEKFDMKISIEKSGSGGKIIFHFMDLEQLDTILSKLA